MVNLATASPVTPHRGTIALLDIDDDTVALLGDALQKGYRYKTFDAHEPLVSGHGMGTVLIVFPYRQSTPLPNLIPIA